jgi:hypothetical protein
MVLPVPARVKEPAARRRHRRLDQERCREHGDRWRTVDRDAHGQVEAVVART